jgi:hypothetical protein
MCSSQHHYQKRHFSTITTMVLFEQELSSTRFYTNGGVNITPSPAESVFQELDFFQSPANSYSRQYYWDECPLAPKMRHGGCEEEDQHHHSSLSDDRRRQAMYPIPSYEAREPLFLPGLPFLPQEKQGHSPAKFRLKPRQRQTNASPSPSPSSASSL